MTTITCPKCKDTFDRDNFGLAGMDYMCPGCGHVFDPHK